MLLDTASLYFRAYFGVPESLRAPDGTPVNAVRGLLDFIGRLVKDHRPSHLVACLDADWRPAWRVHRVPSYKAHRVADPEGATPADGSAVNTPGQATSARGVAEQIPDTLAPQVPIIETVLDALGIARVGVPEYEADDVIGALTAHPEQACPELVGTRRHADRIDVVTGDRDLFQVVDDAHAVRVLYPTKGVGSPRVTDEAALREKYGVDGSGYADLALLRGDPSDGLYGVPGIGEKTAAALLAQYGSLSGVLAAVDDPNSAVPPARRRRLHDAREYLAAAAPVVRVATDAPVPRLNARLPQTPAEPQRLEELTGRFGLGGALRRLLDTLAEAGG